MGRNRKKLPGHYCWCCGGRRANGRFSNRGRRMHVCKDCMKLGPEELAYRQEVHNIDRLLTWDGIIRRKCRAVFERYLSHQNVRVLEHANKVKEHNEQRRQELRELYKAERLEEERCEQHWTEVRSRSEATPHNEDRDPGDEAGQEDIPF